MTVNRKRAGFAEDDDLDYFKDIASKLISARKACQLSQREASKQLGIAASVLCKYEKAQVVPSLSIFIRIAKLYNVSFDTVLDIKSNDASSIIEHMSDAKFDALSELVKDDIDDHVFIEMVLTAIKIRRMPSSVKAYIQFILDKETSNTYTKTIE